jgi:hypothetical protein
MTMIHRLLALNTLFMAAALVSALGQDTLDFQPIRVIAQRFPAITDAEFTKGSAAKIEGNELVLGVYTGGHARAYPINMLTGPTREIINDKLGGQAIAATW